MTSIQDTLFALQDPEYADFQCKLTPNIPPERCIGVRVPEVRKLAKELSREKPETVSAFLSALPHRYYDENMLHGLLISEIRDFDACIEALRAFLPFVDNWAVCDTMSPKCFRKNKAKLLPKVMAWMKSAEPYTIRFGIEMLMSHFLDDDFRPEYLKAVAAIRSDQYYVNMMIAWFFATALSKQWESTVPYLETGALDPWVHRKTIQKARESHRITDTQKQYLLECRK